MTDFAIDVDKTPGYKAPRNEDGPHGPGSCANERSYSVAEENIYQFLERRERELQNRLSFVQTQLAEVEAELNAVRHAKETLRLPADGSLGLGHLGAHAVEHILSVEGPSALGGIKLPEYVVRSLSNPIRTQIGPNVWEHVSIKVLIMDALRKGRFGPYAGATASQIREYIKDVFKRDVERTSLSPQLSRLRDEGHIEQSAEGRWILSKRTERASGVEPNDDSK